VKSYVRNTINLSCAKILLTSVIDYKTMRICGIVLSFKTFNVHIISFQVFSFHTQHCLVPIQHFSLLKLVRIALTHKFAAK